MDKMRVELGAGDWDREPTAQEVAAAPVMTHAEQMSIMKSSEYRTSKLVQKLVAASIAKSTPVQAQETRFDGSEPEAVQTHDEIAAKHQTFKALFSDNRYKTDPAYRFEVSQKLSAMTANDGTLDPNDMKTPNQVVSVGLSSSPYRGADLSVRKFHRVELAPSTSQEAPKRAAGVSRSGFAGKPSLEEYLAGDENGNA